jgi:hypothetical protein
LTTEPPDSPTHNSWIYTLTDRAHPTDTLDTTIERCRQRTITLINIEVVHARNFNRDPNLTLCRLRNRNFDQLGLLGTTILTDNDRLHTDSLLET